MYNPKQTGFFPIIQLKVEESLSTQEKEDYLKLETLEDRIRWIHKLPRVSSDHQDNVLRQLCKPDFGKKSKEKSIANRENGNAQFYAGSYKQALILYNIAVFTAPEFSKGKRFRPDVNIDSCS